jgi:hypothetical protein
MSSDEVQKYIEDGLKSGKTIGALKEELVSKGVEPVLIDQVVEEARKIKEEMPEAPPAGTVSKRLYPVITINRIKDPRRAYAFPIFGGLVKLITLIPQMFMLWFASLCVGISLLINPFVVLFTGRYWMPAYDWVVKYTNLQVKMSFFLYGLTNRYPGFSFSIQDSYIVNVPYPTVPNKLYAIPLLGLAIRAIPMIPFSIYSSILSNAGSVMAFFSSFGVLFKGYYPESTFELVRDATRVNMAASLYFAGISDTVPTFKISKNHLGIKLLFIFFGVLLTILNTINNISDATNPEKSKRYKMYPTPTPTYEVPYKVENGN